MMISSTVELDDTTFAGHAAATSRPNSDADGRSLRATESRSAFNFGRRHFWYRSALTIGHTKRGRRELAASYAIAADKSRRRLLYMMR